MKNYEMPYIEDKNIFKAVSFARSLAKKMGMGLAIYKAAKYYGVDEKTLAKYLGKFASNVKAKYKDQK